MKTKTGMETRCSLSGLEAGKRWKDERNKINPTRRQINPSCDSSCYVGVRGQKLPLFQLRCPERSSYAFTSDRFKYLHINTVYNATVWLPIPRLFSVHLNPSRCLSIVDHTSTQMALVIHLMSDLSHFYIGRLFWALFSEKPHFHSCADEVWIYLPL